MSIRQASSIYKSLSEDQKKLIDEKMISATLPVKHWMAFLKKAAAYDELGEKAVRQYLVYMIILIVLGVVSLVVISDYWQAGVPFFLVVAVLLVLVIINYRKFKGRDLTNHLRLFLLPLLVVLKDKAGDKTKLSMSLDLRSPMKTEPVKVYQQDNRKIKLFEPKYVIGKIKLLDEAMFEFLLQDEIRRLRIKKTRGGKTKIKFKFKVARFYFIKLSFPKKYYKTKNGNGDSVRLSETDEHYVCKVKVKNKTDRPKDVVKLEDFLKSVNELYDLVEARPGAKFPEKVEEKQRAVQDRIEDRELEEMEDTGMGVVPFMVWHHTYFTDYDYDSFEYAGGGGLKEGVDRDSFFDS